MQQSDSERQIGVIVALDYRPAFGGNRKHSTPRGCFSDETGAHKIRPGIGKEIKVRILKLCGAVRKPFPKDKATDLLGHCVRIESPFSKEKSKVSEKQHILFNLEKIFKGTQARRIGPV
jgi:hypothetical protein